MQQTEKYKLNLIEPSDPFLPDALNANTQRVEDVLIDRMEGSLDAMDQRITVLEGFQMAMGKTTIGTTVTLPFTPVFVLVHELYGDVSGVCVEGCDHHYVKLIDHGFTNVNVSQAVYLAFGHL